MGKTLHILGCPKNIVYKYRTRASLPKLMVLTEKPVQGPVDTFSLRNVPIATAILETDVSTQRVIVALDETYDRDVGGMSKILVDFTEIQTIQNDMNLSLCILFNSGDPGLDECVYIMPKN
jgi:hypothetical protein